MNNQKPLVDSYYLLERFPGKGGWTYILLPEIPPAPLNPFGWVLVTGRIDGYELKKCRLMPMGNGLLFLPVNARIRKAIRKEAGERVHLILYPDVVPEEAPPELVSCLEIEPEAHQAFLNLSQREKKHYLNWIHESKTEEIKIERINKMLDELKVKRK